MCSIFFQCTSVLLKSYVSTVTIILSGITDTQAAWTQVKVSCKTSSHSYFKLIHYYTKQISLCQVTTNENYGSLLNRRQNWASITVLKCQRFVANALMNAKTIIKGTPWQFLVSPYQLLCSVTCTIHYILLWLSYQEGWHEMDMYHVWKRREIHEYAKCLSENLYRREHSEELDIDGRIILEWILET